MSSSSEDGESPQKRQRVGLYDRLRESSFIKYDNPKLIGFLTEKSLNGLAGEATSGEMSGKRFLAKMTELDEGPPDEMKRLAELANSDPVFKAKFGPPKEDLLHQHHHPLQIQPLLRATTL